MMGERMVMQEALFYSFSVKTRPTLTPPQMLPSALNSLGKIEMWWGHASRDK